jgi:hypothetical protein
MIKYSRHFGRSMNTDLNRSDEAYIVCAELLTEPVLALMFWLKQ